MLYDKRWDAKADPFTLPSLIEWLEQQPRNATYQYCNPHNCLLCQYFRDKGIDVRSIARNEIWLNDGGVIEFPEVFSWDVANSPLNESTYGAALKRARTAARVA